MKTPEQLKEYQHKYYMQHKDIYYQQFRDWCKVNPKRVKVIQDKWLAKRPHYQRDYRRKRKATVEPLIFQFLDNGFGRDMDGYITYLRNRGVPEKHIRWFEVDVKKHLEGGVKEKNDSHK